MFKMWKSMILHLYWTYYGLCYKVYLQQKVFIVKPYAALHFIPLKPDVIYALSNFKTIWLIHHINIPFSYHNQYPDIFLGLDAWNIFFLVKFLVRIFRNMHLSDVYYLIPWMLYMGSQMWRGIISVLLLGFEFQYKMIGRWTK